jgi:uncharacterized protein (UPF0261 family)
MKKSCSKAILIIATLDTKGPETKYLKDLIESKGHRVLVMDTGILGPPHFQPDLSRDEVAQAAGTHIEELIRSKNKGRAIQAMAEGSKRVVQQLYREEKITGIILTKHWFCLKWFVDNLWIIRM